MTSAKQANSLLMINSSSKMMLGLLSRGIAHTADSRQALLLLAHKLVSVAETAYSCRDFIAIKEATDLLIALPIAQAQRAGLWYQAVIDVQNGQNAQAVAILQNLMTDPQAPPRYRGRAFQSLGAFHLSSGNRELARQMFLESVRYIRKESPGDALVLADAVILHGLVRSDEGDIPQALKELASIESLVDKIRNPHLTVFYNNNVAVDLQELGRLEEAAYYSRKACSSPVAYAYRGCQETAEEIRQQIARTKAVAVKKAVAWKAEARKRRAQPKYLLEVMRFSPSVRKAKPKQVRQRVTCKNPTTERVALVARIRAPSRTC